MKILRLLCLLVFVAADVVTSRACDLCGCYTPQLNAMPGMESTHFFPWLAGWYAAVGEQFTVLRPFKWMDTKSQIRPDNMKTVRSRRLWSVTKSTAASLF